MSSSTPSLASEAITGRSPLPAQMPKLLRVSEVSQMTGVPVATLAFWRHQRIGPASAKLGRHVVYREADVIAFVEAQFAKNDDGGSAA